LNHFDVNTAKKRVTLRDVAQVAGVSLKTASNVINDNGRMSEDTRAKVHQVIKDLGYRVNVSARNLNKGVTGSINLAVPSLVAPYLAVMADKIIDAARERDYSVYVTTYTEDSALGARTFLRSFNSTVSDGVILSMSELEKFSPEDLKVDFPLVCLGSRTTWHLADHITTDEIEDAGSAARYLFERGAKKLAVVGTREEFDAVSLEKATEGNAELRLRGILTACKARGRVLDPSLIGFTGYDWSIGAGYKTVQRMLDEGKEFDSVICLNDQLAIGVVSALATNGIAIPEEVQVIGFDDIEESRYLQPPLTTVDSSLDWIAPTAVDRLIGRIQGEITDPVTMRAKSKIHSRATTRE
jgi:DNA-binding LacI/PurR family transcriptional regulator